MSGYGRFSTVRHYDRSNKNDCEVVYSDATHSCIMKLCTMVDADNSLEYEDYRRFHLRFYIPKFALNTKDKRVDRLMFMFNGLNELDYFTLYDQIGQVLSQRGIASVLIPMPDHLNRHTKWRFRNLPDGKILRSPLDDIREHPASLHTRFLQLANEIDDLYNAITNLSPPTNNSGSSFYRNIFGPKIRISCLGYSMGGLAALGVFLSNPERYNACVLLNSGVQLRDIKLPTSMISQSEWQDIVERASSDFLDAEDSIYSQLFGQLFLGNMPALTTKKLKPHTRKLLFVFGGADSVIPMKSIGYIEPEGRGLPIFQIPGISHFPAIDREWNSWYQFTINLIADFEENASHEYWSKQEMIERIVNLKKSYRFFSSPKEWNASAIQNQTDYDHFHKIYYSHKLFFPDFRVLLGEAILHEFEKDRHSYSRDDKWCSKNHLTFEQARHVLKTQIDLLRGGEYKSSGEIVGGPSLGKYAGYPEN